MDKSNTEKFLELYKQLEKTGRENYFPKLPDSAPVINRLTSIPVLREFKEDIEYCRVVRNFLVHTPRVRDISPVIPSDDMINVLERCVSRVKSPVKAMKYAVRRENMYTVSLNDKVSEVSTFMNESGFTHAPVFENNRLVGVFSDNAIYSYICDKRTISINENTILNEIREYLDINNHSNEYFAFISAGANIYEVSNLFNIDVKSMKKLAVIFFTDNGRENGNILGMMTPYSILRDAPEYLN